VNRQDRSVFTLADIRAIRYLMLVLGGVGLVMFLITDRETPLLVVGFVTTLATVPIAAIYVLRRMAARRELNQAETGTRGSETKRPEAKGPKDQPSRPPRDSNQGR
jgi:Flp pilus assembly protein TadB